MIAKTPKAPYYAVIFTSVRTPVDKGYSEMSEKMVKVAQEQPGFLGFETVRNDLGITVSYWKNIESILNWKNHPEHQKARETGKSIWYAQYKVRICKVERDYGWTHEKHPDQ